jgi:Domain of unknown function DUF29
MSDTLTKRPKNALYDTDFYAWTQEQARLLREQRWGDLDLDNLADEVEGVGRSEKREIEHRLEILIAHLLKWTFQPGGRGSSWRGTIGEQRHRLRRLVEDSPSLRGYLQEEALDCYRAGRLRASAETGIAFGLFPEESPFTPEQILDPAFFPEDRSIE